MEHKNKRAEHKGPTLCFLEEVVRNMGPMIGTREDIAENNCPTFGKFENTTGTKGPTFEKQKENITEHKGPPYGQLDN